MGVKVTTANFEDEVLKADRPVLVDFSAAWCGPCQMLAPVLDELAREKAEVLKVVKIDVDEAPELAARYGIASIPALLLFKNGSVSATSVGFMAKADLLAFVGSNA